MSGILEKLKQHRVKSSTQKSYISTWRRFNQFVIRLDKKPDTWEERTAMFLAYLIEDRHIKSATIASYVSAIKSVLRDDGYHWDDNKTLLSSLTRACRLLNDRVITRMLIHCSLLELILFEIQRFYSEQPYLILLYQALFSLGYYGLLQVGELTSGGEHTILAKDIHVATKKDKILIVLYSSKTHHKGSRPQIVRISALNKQRPSNYRKRLFCPFQLMRTYMVVSGNYDTDIEPLFYSVISLQ